MFENNSKLLFPGVIQKCCSEYMFFTEQLFHYKEFYERRFPENLQISNLKSKESSWNLQLKHLWSLLFFTKYFVIASTEINNSHFQTHWNYKKRIKNKDCTTDNPLMTSISLIYRIVFSSQLLSKKVSMNPFLLCFLLNF